MLVEHWPAIEADFRRFYQLDLPDLVFGEHPATARRLEVLIGGLPADSSLIAQDLDPEHRGWGNAEELLALLLETFVAVNSKPGGRFEVPRPYRAAKPKMATAEEMRSFFGGSYVPGGD